MKAGGLLITGFVVCLSSHEPGLAMRAVVLGVMAPTLAGAVALVLPYTIASGHLDEIVPDLAGTVLVGLLVLIPVALGFGVGRVVRPSLKG